MKTMHHFCDNCLNYCSEWMAHLGWSLLSLSEKRQLLSFIFFVPSVQHETLPLRPPNLVVRFHLFSSGSCVRQQSCHIGRVTFPQQPLPRPLQQCSCMGQPLQIFTYTGSYSIHLESCKLMLAEEAALPSKPPVWWVAGPLLGYWSRLWTPELFANNWLCICEISARDKTGEEDGDAGGNPSANVFIQCQSLWGKGWSCTDDCWWRS